MVTLTDGGVMSDTLDHTVFIGENQINESLFLFFTFVCGVDNVLRNIQVLHSLKE